MGSVEGFESLESGLFQCKECKTTFESELECERHLEESDLDSEMTEERELACNIMDIFEDFLQGKNIEIPNKERDEYETDEETEKCILFGSEYYSMEDEITEMIRKYKKGLENA